MIMKLLLAILLIVGMLSFTYNQNRVAERYKASKQKSIPKKLIKEVSFGVAGITSDGKQRMLEEMLNKYFKAGLIKKYDGKTNKEIINAGFTVFEANEFSFKDVNLILTKESKKPMIEVQVKDLLTNEFITIGYVPKYYVKDVNEFWTFKEEHSEYIYEAKAMLLGGKGKTIDGKSKIEKFEMPYNMEVSLILYSEGK